MSTAHALHYLTVQDILWLHLQVMGKSMPFPYAKLEEATFTQFSYGTSHDPIKQASALLKGFAKVAPFGVADKVVAYLGCRAFLGLNGYSLDLPDAEAAGWVNRVLSGEVNPQEALQKLAHANGAAHVEVAEVLESVLRDSPLAIAALAS